MSWQLLSFEYLCWQWNTKTFHSGFYLPWHYLWSGWPSSLLLASRRTGNWYSIKWDKINWRFLPWFLRQMNMHYWSGNMKKNLSGRATCTMLNPSVNLKMKLRSSCLKTSLKINLLNFFEKELNPPLGKERMAKNKLFWLVFGSNRFTYLQMKCVLTRHFQKTRSH